MSEMTTTTTPHDPALAARAIQLGGEGCSVREIAVALGLSLAALQARRDEDADFDEAMVRAEEAAHAWWEGLPRAALAEGRRFDHVAWREAMRARFGPGDPEREAAEPSPYGGVIILPCNGTDVRLPDGTCPNAHQDTSRWPREWFEKYEPRSCPPARDYDDDDYDEPDENAGFAPGYDDEDDEEA